MIRTTIHRVCVLACQRRVREVAGLVGFLVLFGLAGASDVALP